MVIQGAIMQGEERQLYSPQQLYLHLWRLPRSALQGWLFLKALQGGLPPAVPIRVQRALRHQPQRLTFPLGGHMPLRHSQLLGALLPQRHRQLPVAHMALHHRHLLLGSHCSGSNSSRGSSRPLEEMIRHIPRCHSCSIRSSNRSSNHSSTCSSNHISVLPIGRGHPQHLSQRSRPGCHPVMTVANPVQA